MKKLELEIKTCLECPFRSYRSCDHVNGSSRKELDVDKWVIPGWCPLEDVIDSAYNPEPKEALNDFSIHN